MKTKNRKQSAKSTSNGFVAPVRLDFGCGPNKRDGFLGVDSIAFPGVNFVVNLAEPIYDPPPSGFEWMVEKFERKATGYKPWPWPDCSVEEAHSSHFVEHLTSIERIHFVNELYRVLTPGAKCTIIVPHWASCRAYGDPTHQWSAVSEFWFYYLLRSWRLGAEIKCPHCEDGMRHLAMGANGPAAGKVPCEHCGANGKTKTPGNAPHTDASVWPQGFSCDFDATWGYSMHPQIVAKSQDAQQYAMSFYKEACQDIIATLVCRKPLAKG